MQEEIDVERLITLVSEERAIWDKARDDYHSRAATTDAWRCVCSELNADFAAMSKNEKNAYGKFVIKKWRNIRDQWAKACRKVSEQKKTGTSAKTPRYYIYHDQLSFLDKTFTCTETESNFGQGKDESHTPDETAEKNVNLRDRGMRNSLERLRRRRKDGGEESGRKKQNLDVEARAIQTLQGEDPKLCFFKSLLPAIKDFSDDEILQLQSGVITLVQNIKRARLS